MPSENYGDGLLKKYLADTVTHMLDQDLYDVNAASRGRTRPRALPRNLPNLPLQEKNKINSRHDQEIGTGSDYNYDAAPSMVRSEIGSRFMGKNTVNSSKMGPFFYDMAAGTFGIGGVEFDFRHLDGRNQNLNEALVLVITELLLFINDIKGNDKYKSVFESYVSNIDNIPQSAMKDVSLPVIDAGWAYPGPVYVDRNLPSGYKLKENDEVYCGRCYNYVGGSRVGKCHRWNNAVTAYYKCSSFRDRDTSFYSGDNKGRFKATDSMGKNVGYSKGDIVTFNGKTYVAVKNTSALTGSPIHSNSGWRIIDQDILDGGEY